MSDYRNSDYALNKFSEGIVYRFSGEIRVVTMEDYLRENPDKSKEDFEKLKALSDQIYLEELREENTHRITVNHDQPVQSSKKRLLAHHQKTAFFLLIFEP